MCQNEALCRSISIGLRSGVLPEVYIKSLKGIRCPNPMSGASENVALSCPDAIGKILERECLNGKKGTNT